MSELVTKGELKKIIDNTNKNIEKSYKNTNRNIEKSNENIVNNMMFKFDLIENIKYDTGVSSDQAPDVINGIPTGAKPGRKTIHLGLLSDYSGPFSPIGPELEKYMRLFWKNVNEKSLLGDQFNVVIDQVRDTGYDLIKHKDGYLSIKDNILALALSLGTVQTLGIYNNMVSDNILSNPLSWWSGWDKPEYKNVLSFGASHFVDAVNVIDYVKNNDSRKDNLNKVFVSGFDDYYGGDYALGVKYACENISSLELVGEYLPPVFQFNIETLLQKLIESQADIICLAVSPSQCVQIYGGLFQTLGNAFFQKVFCLPAPSYMDEFVKPDFELASLFLGGNTYLTNYSADLTFNTDGKQILISLLTKENIASRSNIFTAGYVSQYPLFNVLKKSIEKRDIRRQSLVANVDETGFDYEGFLTKKLHNGLKLDSYICMPGETITGIKKLGFFMSDLLVVRGTAPP